MCLLCCKVKCFPYYELWFKHICSSGVCKPKGSHWHPAFSPSLLFNVLCQSPDPPLEGALLLPRLAPCGLAMAPPALPPLHPSSSASLSPHLFPCALPGSVICPFSSLLSHQPFHRLMVLVQVRTMQIRPTRL